MQFFFNDMQIGDGVFDSKLSMLIGHFRVPLSLTSKASLSAKFLSW